MRVTNVNTCTWTPEKDAQFVEKYMNGATYAELATHFNTSISAAEKRRMWLKLPSPTQLREQTND